MKSVHLAGVLGLAAMAAPGAAAQVYTGVSYTEFAYERTIFPGLSDLTEEITFGAVTARAGYQASPFLAFEAEASFGVSGGGETGVLGLPPSAPGQMTPIELGNTYAMFAVAKLPIPMIGEVFARAGMGNIGIDVSNATTWREVGGSGGAYGVGVELNLVAMLRGRVDCTRFDIDEGFDAASASLLLKF